MKRSLRKTIKELLAMSSADVRAYIGTLPTSEKKRISTELYRVMLGRDMQRIRNLYNNPQHEAG